MSDKLFIALVEDEESPRSNIEHDLELVNALAFPTTPNFSEMVFDWGKSEQSGDCHSCNSPQDVIEIYEPDTRTWNISGSLCLVGCWLGICLLPLFFEKFKQPFPYCKKCKTRVNIENSQLHNI